MAAFGQRVCWLGHSVGTSGQVVAPVGFGQRVCCTEQAVRLPAPLQMVTSNGHWVTVFGQLVCFTGQIVAEFSDGQMVE